MRQQIETTTSVYDSETLQGRLAKLAGDVTVIRVGGATQVSVEVREKKDWTDDALHADVPQSKRASPAWRRCAVPARAQSAGWHQGGQRRPAVWL
jgi:hypothetical protein